MTETDTDAETGHGIGGPIPEQARTPAAAVPGPSGQLQGVMGQSIPGPDTPNPLRDPSDRRLPRVPEPCALVIFGIGGDLSRKKLIAAIYDLANRGLLPTDFQLIGFSRADWPEGGGFEAMARRSAKDHARTVWNEEVWRRLSHNTQFVEGSFDDDAAIDELVRVMEQVKHERGTLGNAAFYLSIPPTLFPAVLQQMQRTGLADAQTAGGWRRVVVEKPFGHDLASRARELNAAGR